MQSRSLALPDDSLCSVLAKAFAAYLSAAFTAADNERLSVSGLV